MRRCRDCTDQAEGYTVNGLPRYVRNVHQEAHTIRRYREAGRPERVAAIVGAGTG